MAFSSSYRKKGLHSDSQKYYPCSLPIYSPESCCSLLSELCMFTLLHVRSCNPSWKNWNSWCLRDFPRCPKVDHRLDFFCLWGAQKSNPFGNWVFLRWVSKFSMINTWVKKDEKVEENLLKVSCYLVGLESSICSQFYAINCWMFFSNCELITIYCSIEMTWSKKHCSWDCPTSKMR